MLEKEDDALSKQPLLSEMFKTDDSAEQEKTHQEVITQEVTKQEVNKEDTGKQEVAAQSQLNLTAAGFQRTPMRKTSKDVSRQLFINESKPLFCVKCSVKLNPGSLFCHKYATCVREANSGQDIAPGMAGEAVGGTTTKCTSTNTCSHGKKYSIVLYCKVKHTQTCII